MHSEADLKEQSVIHSVATWRMAVASINLRLANENVGLAFVRFVAWN